MEQIVTIVEAIIFLLLGYFLGRLQNDPEIIKKTVRQIKKLNNQVKPGVIDYPSQADIDYAESGEDKVDEAREKVFKEQFKV